MTMFDALGRPINHLLGRFGLRLSRIHRADQILDPVARSIAKGLSASSHNSRENMDAIYSDPHFMSHYVTNERRAFYASVRDRLGRLPIAPRDVLDVGCGSGHLVAELCKLYPNAQIEGIDFSEASIRIARGLNETATFDVQSIFDLERRNRRYDLVLCVEVLEHLERADEAMRNLVAACRPGGTIIVTVPHGRHDTFAGHFNFWTPESFSREFREVSPRVEELGSYLFIVISRPTGTECAI